MSANKQDTAGPNLRILVLEDEPMIAGMLEEWLCELQCAPIGPAATADEALALIAHGPLAGAILDVTLKGGDSFQVAEAMLEKNLPFAFATGRDPQTLTDRFAGASILLKPFDFDAISALVGRWRKAG